MGLFSALAGIIGGNSQKKASQKASDAQIAAYNRGIDLQQKQYDTTRADYMPYTQAGTSAIGRIGDFQGLNGEAAKDSAFVTLKDDPRYASLFTDGKEALLQNSSATGGLRGGNTEGALAQLSPDVLSRVYDMVLSGLGGTAQLGLGATGSVANAGLANANAATSLTGQIGQAKAANYLTKGGINAGNWANIGGALDQAASAFLPIGFGGITAASTAKTQGASLDLINANRSIF